MIYEPKTAVNDVEAIQTQMQLLDQRESDLLALQPQLVERMADGNDPEAENAYALLPGQFATLTVQRQRLADELERAKTAAFLQEQDATFKKMAAIKTKMDKLTPKMNEHYRQGNEIQAEINMLAREWRALNEPTMYALSTFADTELDGNRTKLLEIEPAYRQLKQRHGIQ